MRLLLEGWRGIGQSLALVNQFQALALLAREEVQLFHRDMPTALAWDSTRHGAGFEADATARISAIPSHTDEPVDAVYRIMAPSRSGANDDRRKTLTFMVTELGLHPGSFDPQADRTFFTRDENLVITPSNWSADRIVEAGFAADRVRIIPHGVDRGLFYPLAHRERESVRKRLGFESDETVLLNIGGPFWNKGVDLLLEAFAILRARGRRVRLVCKDQSTLYGPGMSQLVSDVGARRPELLAADTIAAITLIPGTLNFAQMRELYAVADAYVSPYRAEGFNLPVLEAIACGVPVVVSSGGATDDFCPDAVATKLPVVQGELPAEGAFPPRRFVQPRLDDLVDALDRLCQGPARVDELQVETEALLREFSWARAASLLLNCAGPEGAALEAAPSARPLPPSQKQILELMNIIRPHDTQYVGPAPIFSRAPEPSGDGDELREKVAHAIASFQELVVPALSTAVAVANSSQQLGLVSLETSEFVDFPKSEPIILPIMEIRPLACARVISDLGRNSCLRVGVDLRGRIVVTSNRDECDGIELPHDLIPGETAKVVKHFASLISV